MGTSFNLQALAWPLKTGSDFASGLSSGKVAQLSKESVRQWLKQTTFYNICICTTSIIQGV